jgi:type II secretory pathway pseudopilin PulG
MTIAIVVAICIVILILAFLAPRLSRYPQRGVQKTYSAGGNTAGKAPGRLGRWLRKPFDSANKWTGKSGSAGRRGRSKTPL